MQHACKCTYRFDCTPCEANAVRDVAAGEELLICYGASDGPLFNTHVYTFCFELNEDGSECVRLVEMPFPEEEDSELYAWYEEHFCYL